MNGNDFFASLYAKTFSRGLMSKVNNRILSYALKARGYNNTKNNRQSGESYFIRNVLAKENPRLCIDIGANVGGYTSELLRCTLSRVIAFEPLPLAFAKLVNNVVSFSDRVVLENKGIANTNSEMTIHYNPCASSHASFSEEVKKVSYVSNQMEALVPVVTLDQYCLSKGLSEIDLIKIDTEGFEGEVLKGARHCIERIRPKYVQIEFNWHHLFSGDSLYDLSNKLPGYDMYQLLPESWVQRNPADPLSNIFGFSNFVFVRR